ncbi:DinB family protein [Wenyingzhuangia sp. IMCC45574]
MKRTDLPFIPEFYDRYINYTLADVDLIDGLIASQTVLEDFKEELIKLQDYRYQEGKWTCKEVVQHLIDNERVMSYRAMALARGEQTPLPGYEQDDYAANCNANLRTMESLLEEFKVVRQATIILFQSFPDEVLLNVGICSNIKMTPLALGLVCIGHAAHHVGVLQERYLD